MLRRLMTATSRPLGGALAVLLAMLLAMASPGLEAQGPRWMQEPTQQQLQRPPPAEQPPVSLTLDEAAALVRQRTGGRVVRADRREQGNRLVYEIRILTEDGRVRTYRVDAVTGAMR